MEGCKNMASEAKGKTTAVDPTLAARASFMCVLRHPSSSPGEPDVQGTTVYQFSDTTEIRLDSGETYTFDSTELRAAVASLTGEEVREGPRFDREDAA